VASFEPKCLAQFDPKYPLNGIKEFKNYKEKIGTTEKKVIIAENRINDFEKISGNFIHIGKYIYIQRSSDEYSVNQLVNIDSLKLENEDEIMNEYGKIYTLLKNSENENLFYCDSNFIYDFGFDQELLTYSKLLKDNGYPTLFKGKELYIKKSNTELKVTRDMFDSIKNENYKYINQIFSSVNKFKLLINQAEPITEKLTNHFSAHQHFTMTDERLKVWKNDTKKANIILTQIKNLKGNEPEVNNYFLEKIDNKNTQKYIEFLEILNGTKVVLGM